jgi:SET domain-containing protein
MTMLASHPNYTRRYRVVKIQVRVGPSRIAGQGLFAAQDIKKDTDILQYVGEKITKQESARRLALGNPYIFTFNERYDVDGKVFRNTARYANHSCDPNCEAQKTHRAIWIVALRDIQAGEELTYNYGYGMDNDTPHPCTCGAQNCCGYMLARQYWGLLKRHQRQ